MTTAKDPDSAQNTEFSHLLQVAALARSLENKVDLVPDTAARAALASDLGLLGLRKVSLRGSLNPVGKRDWRLQARLGATIVQPCVVTLMPVTTRIEESVERIWRAKPRATGESGSEEEMPEDTSEEKLGDALDLGRVLSEALALALPAYPRADGANLEDAVFAAPGITPMRDEDTRPFAGLADLRDRLTDREDGKDGGED